MQVAHVLHISCVCGCHQCHGAEMYVQTWSICLGRGAQCFERTQSKPTALHEIRVHKGVGVPPEAHIYICICRCISTHSDRTRTYWILSREQRNLLENSMAIRREQIMSNASYWKTVWQSLLDTQCLNEALRKVPHNSSYCTHT